MGKFNSCYIIDDDEFFSLNAMSIMMKADFSDNVLCYTDGQQAIDSLIGLLIEGLELPEVIFLDLNMPRKNGWTFLEEFSNIPWEQRKNCHIYIISSFISPENMERAKTYSMVNEYLVKPLTVELLEGIKKSLDIA